MLTRPKEMAPFQIDRGIDGYVRSGAINADRNDEGASAASQVMGLQREGARTRTLRNNRATNNL